MKQHDLFKQPVKSFPPPRFNGPVYDPRVDQKRLEGGMGRVFGVMQDGCWRTLSEIAFESGGTPEASVSAFLRHLRKPRFGGHTVNKRRVSGGLWAYQLIENK